ncbi:MAG: mitochondrial fission ELM1 family protein [Alphaproteobacteria bacterium]|nr:mitochondrial fission ELM1 family protein [Alphaproteobacteria bacterium]
MESQCVGLAEALGITPVIKRTRLRKFWRDFSPYVNLWKRLAFSRKGDKLSPPWPDMVIATGRQSVLPALHIKQMSGGKTFLVQIQSPAIPASNFDMVIVPEHDKLEGKNVVSVKGALHRVAPDMLKAEADKWAPQFTNLPRPYVAVLLGGTNGSYRLDPAVMMQLGPQLANLSKQEKVSLLVTPSRRTGDANMVLLSALLHDTSHYIWDGKGDNPYYGMLGLADAVIVTCDSINMISEACRIGKPVYVVPLPGHSDKFSYFHQSLIADGRIRLFDGTFAKDAWQPKPLDEMARVASIVKRVYLAKNN